MPPRWLWLSPSDNCAIFRLSSALKYCKFCCRREEEPGAAMNILTRAVQALARPMCMAPVVRAFANNPAAVVGVKNNRPLLDAARELTSRLSCLTIQERDMSMTLNRMHRLGPHIKKRKSKNPLDGKPFRKAIVQRLVIKKPKKPNSANRKCVVVKFTDGKEMVAYVPGIGHNLQEHNTVLVKVGKLQDCPGVRLKCVRGRYDLKHVIPREQKK